MWRLKKTPELQDMTVEQLKVLANMGTVTWLYKALRKSVAHLSGSSGKMRYYRKLAYEILLQNKPHFFQTCSYADKW